MRNLLLPMACVALSLSSIALGAGAEPMLLPVPKMIRMGEGRFAINQTTRIVATDATLAPLAKVLSSEVRLKTGLTLAAASGPATTKEIGLALGEVPGGEEAYRLLVTPELVQVVGNTYQGVAWGTVTLLQAIDGAGPNSALPAMEVQDAPRFAYRGFMKDVARQDVPIEQLYAAVNLCRLYKVRYLHLHLSDDHAFVFPSTKYPQLGSRNSGAHSGPAPKVYDLARLKDLVRYADERGVTLVPEIDGPGHSDAMRKPLADLLDSPKTPGGGARLGLLNMCSERMYQVMDDLIGEVAEVFASSPYIHIGADEVNTGAIKGAAEYADFIKKHNMKGPHEVFVYYTQRMVEMVAKRGKTAIAWEGVPLDDAKPGSMVYMAWTQSRHHGAISAVKRGLQVIEAPNSAFFGQQEIHDVPIFKDPLGYNLLRHLRWFGAKQIPTGFADNPLILGAQVNDWESTWEYTLPVARRAVAGASANAWNATADQPVEPLMARFLATDALLEQLIQPARVTLERLDTFDQRQAVQQLRRNMLFTRPITLSVDTSVPGATVRYTTDGSDPTGASPAFNRPMEIDQTTTVWLGVFDDTGAKLAPLQRIPFEKINYAHSLATGKPVKVSGQQGNKDTRPYLVDGFAKFDIWRGWWGASPVPQWAEVDLEKPETIDRIDIFPYWDGHRVYQFTISTSNDEKNWTVVVDQSKNKTPATADGFSYRFEPVLARYVRVDVTRNSANEAAHIVDLRVFGPDEK